MEVVTALLALAKDPKDSASSEVSTATERILRAARADQASWSEDVAEWLQDGAIEPSSSISDPLLYPFAKILVKLGRTSASSDLMDFMRGHTQLTLLVGRLARRPHSAELINRSLLVSAISAFEALLADIVRACLERHPQLASGGKQYSLGDVITLGQKRIIEDAIANRVDALMREDFDGWRKWFQEKSRLNVDIASLAIHWPNVVELFARRNAIVHTRAMVNRDYLTRVEASPPIGTELITDFAYLRDSFGELLAIGTILWQKAYENVTQRDASWMLNYVAAEIRDLQLHRAAARLYQYLRNNTDAPDDSIAYALEELFADWRSGDLSAFDRLKQHPKLSVHLRVNDSDLWTPRIFDWFARNKSGDPSLLRELQEMDTSQLSMAEILLRATLLSDNEATQRQFAVEVLYAQLKSSIKANDDPGSDYRHVARSLAELLALESNPPEWLLSLVEDANATAASYDVATEAPEESE